MTRRTTIYFKNENEKVLAQVALDETYYSFIRDQFEVIVITENDERTESTFFNREEAEMMFQKLIVRFRNIEGVKKIIQQTIEHKDITISTLNK